ncbi:DDE-type integrase/transposase/recombinase [Actinopolyspora halophila]|uniref:DDE-type integrase/transposase/recombinase n=1 Tax=Actinopolyspora halophila TaxID=1850 RepID=UPI0003A36D10|nr:DDE-type integrase/transposase/recombinase [Actinopolyspora halophila]
MRIGRSKVLMYRNIQPSCRRGITLGLGYALAERLSTELSTDCLNSAVGFRGSVVAGVIFHSDRGCQCTSTQLAQRCAKLGIRHLLGRTGICGGNAVVESFFGALKRKLVHRHRFTARAQAREVVFTWTRTRCNRQDCTPLWTTPAPSTGKPTMTTHNPWQHN